MGYKYYAFCYLIVHNRCGATAPATARCVYVQQSREEIEVLFTLLAERYERGSVLLTSNLPFSKWELIFKDPMTTAAAIDRLVHHSVILELNVSSYRLATAKDRSESEKSPEEPSEKLPEKTSPKGRSRKASTTKK